MNAPFPFFYYDLVARLIPGGATLALLSLTRLDLPSTWAEYVDWLWSATPGAAIMMPLVLGALSYGIGLIHEVALSKLLWRVSNRAFYMAALAYP